jgi:hypothetical protein
MKKIVLFIAVLMLAGCRPMDRFNETDPASVKYKGLTYLGEIGSFSLLTDFTIAIDPSDSKYYIYAVDGIKNQVHKYAVDGTPVNPIISNPDPPAPQAFFNPTGICAMNPPGYCYIIDDVNIVAFHIVNITNAWQDPSVKGDKILSYGTTLYTVVSDPPGVAPYVPDVNPPQSYAPVTPWVITKGNTSCAACMWYISDIAVNPAGAGEIMLVDSALKRISIFNTAGVHLDNIDVGSDIISAAVWGDTLYVPSTDGIRRYTYSTRTYRDTIANYGEGNGKVMKPGAIELFQNPSDSLYYIYVSAGTFIKVFQINGL